MKKKRCRKHNWRSWDGINRKCILCGKEESMIKTKKEQEQFEREIEEGLHQ